MEKEFRIFRALGMSFAAWFRNFVPITLVAALLYAPVFIYVMTYDYEKATGLDDLVNRAFELPIYGLVGLSALLAPLLTYRVVQDLNGTRVSTMTSIKFGLRGVVPAIVVAIVTSLLQLLPFGGILSAIVTCTWFVAAPAAVAERLSPFAAFTRSSELTRGRRWGIFGLNFVIGLILIIFLIAWIVPSLESGGGLGSLRTTMLISIGVMAFFQTFSGIVQAVSYALLRLDKDGVNSDELARVFE